MSASVSKSKSKAFRSSQPATDDEETHDSGGEGQHDVEEHGHEAEAVAGSAASKQAETLAGAC